jgi:hypothetical protein
MRRQVGVVIGVTLSFYSCGALAQGIPEPKKVTPANAREAIQCTDGDGRCVVRGNGGGQLDLFNRAADMIRRGEMKPLVIDGPCMSGCAVTADRARPRVCITSRAEFYFHQGFHYKKQTRADVGAPAQIEAYFDPPHSSDIRRWVKSKGGFPKPVLNDTGAMLKMSNAEASQFWPRCEHWQPTPDGWRLENARLVNH